MVVRADAGGAYRHLAGVRARVGGELLQRSNWRIAVDGEVARIVDDVAEQLEAVRAAELRRALDRDRHQRRRVDEADGVAVGRRVGERGEADLAARAGAVHDHDLRAAAEVLLEVRGERSRYQVGAAARRVGDDHRDRTLGVRGTGDPGQKG